MQKLDKDACKKRALDAVKRSKARCFVRQHKGLQDHTQIHFGRKHLMHKKKKRSIPYGLSVFLWWCLLDSNQ